MVVGNFWALIQKFGGLGDGWDGALVMRQPTYAFGRISCPLCSRSLHLESGALFPLSLYLAVIVPGVWALLRSMEKWIFREILSPWVQCLVRQWIHALRQYFGGSGRISHILYVAADSDPEVLLSRFFFWQNGEACPVDASGCSFALRSSHVESWKSFLRASRGCDA